MGFGLGNLPAVNKRDCECDGGMWLADQSACMYPLNIAPPGERVSRRFNPVTGVCEEVGKKTVKPPEPKKPVPGTNGEVVQEATPMWVWYTLGAVGAVMVLDLMIRR